MIDVELIDSTKKEKLIKSNSAPIQYNLRKQVSKQHDENFYYENVLNLRKSPVSDRKRRKIEKESNTSMKEAKSHNSSNGRNSRKNHQ